MSPDSFLATHGFAAARRAPLPGDAGHRRYLRLTGGPRPAILMDGSAAAAVGLPSAEADLRAFMAIAAHLRGTGLSAPEVLAADPPAGLMLLEDLGEPTHASLLDAGADPLPLYTAAAETLAALHAAPPPPGLPLWEGETMARAAAATFLDWWWPAALGTDPAPAQRDGVEEIGVELPEMATYIVRGHEAKRRHVELVEDAVGEHRLEEPTRVLDRGERRLDQRVVGENAALLRVAHGGAA